MKIAHIDLGKYPILLAPMEDVTDPAFRLMCKKFGADMVYTEFVSSDALIRAVSKAAQNSVSVMKNALSLFRSTERYGDNGRSSQNCGRSAARHSGYQFRMSSERVAGKGQEQECCRIFRKCWRLPVP